MGRLWQSDPALGWALLLVLSLGITDAAAQPGDVGAAREMAREGQELFKQGEYEQAIRQFEAAEQIIHAPPHLLFIARATDKLGMPLSAKRIYQRLIEEELAADAPEPFFRAQEQGRAELADLEARIPRLLIHVTGPDAPVVTVDGNAVGDLSSAVLVDPGKHEVIASGDGYVTRRQTVSVTGPGETTLSLDLAPMPKEEEVAKPDPGWSIGVGAIPPIAILGTGLAGLIVGAVAGGLATSKMSELEEKCPQNPCPSENGPLKDEVETLAAVSTVAFVVGGMLAAAGGTWLVVDIVWGEQENAATAVVGGTF